jgi:molecular chaperone GrpE
MKNKADKTQPKIDYKAVSEQLADELKDALEQLARERADSLNIRRRAEEEKIKLGGYFKASIVKELLPVIDNFDRALKSVPKDIKDHDYVKGVGSVVKQFEQALSKIGVERIKTVGEKFNPLLHEAVVMDEGDGTEEIISEELQSGYTVGDEVIRHAMVKVVCQ